MHTTLTARSITSAGAVLATAALLLTGCSSAAKTASSAGSTTAATASASPSLSGATTGGTPTGTTSGATAGSSDGTTASGGSGGSGSTGSGSVVVVHNADKGKTVTLHPGQTLEVVLDGGYWAAPASSSASVLRLSRQPSFSSPSPGRGCPPGVGCRAEMTDFMAVSAGTATVSSSRSQCGEAMRCTDANSKFDVTVAVVA